MTNKEITFLGDYINGEFVKASSVDGQWDKYSPSDIKDKVISANFIYRHIDQACAAAKTAFSGWKKTKLEERIEIMHRLKEIFISRGEELARIISRETGKALWESRTEAKALVSKINITIDHSLKLVQESKVKNALPGVDGYIRFKPRGVMSVMGPFNFPAHLPNGHIIPALLTGNTVVFKPSDKTPAVGQFYAQMFHEAGFPKGVFNLVQGQVETGKRIVSHRGVDGVLFTGSYDVGLKIKEATLRQPSKILALEMGGKNVSVVWNDADLEKAIYENIIGSFLSAGQRCSGTSKIILHESIKDQFIDKFYQTAKKIKIGHWSEDIFYGPLIDKGAVEKFVRFQEIGLREGAESIMRGKSILCNSYEGNYVTPSINLIDRFDPDSVYQKAEIFGPNVGIQVVSDFEEAIEINNSSGFGLVMSVFSKDRKYFEKALEDSNVGLLNWNRTTNGASSRLPFGGMGKSGNDRPSAHFAVNYCTVPVASLEDQTDFSGQLMPGIEYSFKD